MSGSLIKFYLSVFKNHKIGISAYYFVRVLYRTLGYVMPTFLVKDIVGILESKPLGVLTMDDAMPVLCGCVAWIVVYVLTDIFAQLLEIYVYPRTKQDAHVKIYQYLIDRSVAFYKNHSAGYLVGQARHVVNGTWKLMWRYPTVAFAIVLGCVANFGMLLQLNWVFVVLIGSALLFRVLHALRCCSMLSKSYMDVAHVASEVISRNTDMLSNFLNLKIFGNRNHEQRYVSEYFEPWVHIKTKSLKFELKFFALPMILEFLSLILTIFVMADFYVAGQMTLAEVSFVLTAFFALRNCVVNFVWEIPEFLDTYYSAAQALKTLTRVSPLICDVTCGTRKCKYDRQITLKNVSFRYEDNWVLRNVNLTVCRGEKVGIVGGSGSGKTTLLNLIMHLYDVTDGKIEIDGVDIKKFSKDSIKKVISFVSQESILFNRTLAENISYGIANVTCRQVIAAAKLAQAHDFIVRTEQGYDTIVGDRGIKLSGGQRQRIAIAHAILKNAPILLLDEATSALDSETEEKIQKSLSYLMQNRTTIAVAHRLSTLKQMDRIIVMDNGTIVEVGTHKQLIQQRGVYYKLWKMQYSGFL